MGLLKTEKLDNGNIAFECIYGGLEAPFGGIDASRAPRYIDPKCFADASNFLIVDNELCICNLFTANFPSNGLTYPIALPTSFAGIPDPGFLLGVGTLPCENIVKNWALYVSSGVDSSNFYHYRLILWTEDTTTVESYDLPIYPRQKLSAAAQATARLKVNYTGSLTSIQSVPEPVIYNNNTDLPITPPVSYNSTVYDTDVFNFGIAGVPTGYDTSWFFNTVSANLWGSTPTTLPSTAPPNPPASPIIVGQLGVPTPASVAKAIQLSIHAQATTTPTFPFDATIDPTDPTIINLVAYSQSGLPPVDGSAGNAITLSESTVLRDAMYFPNTAGYSGTVVTKGSVGNTFPTVIPYIKTTDYPFSNPSFAVSVLNQFAGGTDAGATVYEDQPIQQLTWETVGDSLFLAGWPAGYMLQFSNSAKQLTILTDYEGARVLKKMAGHLITVGAINAIDFNVQNPQLWFNWSKEGVYSEWRALDSAGLVTGAGGEQLADISDALTGLVVSNSVAFILRAEGLSYASVLQSANVPFDVNHVALCKYGQGCPSTSLWTQFDQLGFYVGNSNIFILQQGPQAIGDNILGALYPDLIIVSNRVTSFGTTSFVDAFYNTVNVEPLTLLINNRTVTIYAVNIAGKLYVFSPQDQTWMKFFTTSAFPTLGDPTNPPTYHILKSISLPANGVTGYDGSYQYKASYMYFQQIWSPSLTHPALQAPQLWQFLPNISPSQDSYVIFPAEEISHGRDITIDAIYATISGIPGVEVTFTISGWQRNQDGTSQYVQDVFISNVLLDAEADPRKAEEYQFFNTDGSAVTLKAPQLKLLIGGQTVTPWPDGTIVTPPYLGYPADSNPQFKVSKISMFGSFDPSQRPV